MHKFIVFCASRDFRSALILQLAFAIADFGKPSSLQFIICCRFMWILWQNRTEKKHVIRNHYRDNTSFRKLLSILHTKEIYLGVKKSVVSTRRANIISCNFNHTQTRWQVMSWIVTLHIAVVHSDGKHLVIHRSCVQKRYLYLCTLKLRFWI